MTRLIMMKGLPASGKSTTAKEIMFASGNTVRVNRDLLRKMLHFDKWGGINESLTIEAEKVLAETFLRAGRNVIVDDCNLNPKNEQQWQETARREAANFQINHIDTPWVDCVLRDEVRQESVGGHVIRNMALQYGLVSLPKICICDLDGTLCNLDHRLHFVKEGNKDWKGFFSEIQNDSLYTKTRDILLDYKSQGCDIIFVSARPEEHRKVTEEWLKKNGCDFYFTLLMRKSGDRRDDTDVKRQILNTYFPDRSKIVKVIDDRPRVIAMWRKEGLDVLDVGKGVDF